MTDPRRLYADAEPLAAAYPPLLAEAERVAATVNLGVHGRRKPGVGETFWEYRAYREGDPATRVDWRRSARSDRLYVRENEWEIANTIWIWRSGADRMDFASAKNLPTKRHRASVLALALAILLNRGGERIGLLGKSERASSGSAAVRRIAEELGAAGAARLPRNVELSSHARIVLIGDFLEPTATLGEDVSRLARGTEQGCLLQVLDPAERDFPYSGRTWFQNMTGANEILFGRAQSIRDAYRRREEAHRAALADLAREIGWRISTHWTDHAPQTALLALYQAIAGESGLARRRSA